MELQEIINNSKHTFLHELKELTDNYLELTLVIGRPMEPEKEIDLGGVKLSNVKELGYDKESMFLKVIFKQYSGYSIVNESFDNLGNDGDFTGKWLRVYTKSAFLNYINLVSFHNQISETPILHYCFLCENHIISVASNTSPKIEKLHTTRK